MNELIGSKSSFVAETSIMIIYNGGAKNPTCIANGIALMTQTWIIHPHHF
ncbi:hypothetical protein [Desulfosporosinus sp. BG]|nr:hypothetical protein [Desulfosporosinus sp. BG]